MSSDSISSTNTNTESNENEQRPLPASRYPTTLADLQQQDGWFNDGHDTLYKTIKSLRSATLGLHNRLASIRADARFVEAVAAHYGRLPLLANERCGSWYIAPAAKAGSVYFKSTDGHHGQWAFSLRRLNLSLLAVLERQQQGGAAGAAVIVDSTRRGKRVPDALAKTVGIWCAVVNAVLFPERQQAVDLWHDVGPSERAQIEARLPAWCDGLRSLGLDLAKLRGQVKRPIRCIWAVNGEDLPDDDDDDDDDDDAARHVIQGWRRGDWNLLVLCSASRVVRGAEMSQGGYVQGSGDDHEGWSLGLTPDMFWANLDRLDGLVGDEELAAEIEQLVEEERQKQGEEEAKYVCIDKVSTIYIGIGPASDEDSWDLLINCNGRSDRGSDSKSDGQSDGQSTSTGKSKKKILHLKCRAGKLGSKDLRDGRLALASQAFLELDPKEHRRRRILITCDSGRDLSVGVALVLLCLYYGDDGELCVPPAAPVAADKHLVKQRLSWITSSKPDANPSRATLQAVNSVLIKRPD